MIGWGRVGTTCFNRRAANSQYNRYALPASAVRSSFKVVVEEVMEEEISARLLYVLKKQRLFIKSSLGGHFQGSTNF